MWKKKSTAATFLRQIWVIKWVVGEQSGDLLTGNSLSRFTAGVSSNACSSWCRSDSQLWDKQSLTNRFIKFRWQAAPHTDTVQTGWFMRDNALLSPWRVSCQHEALLSCQTHRYHYKWRDGRFYCWGLCWEETHEKSTLLMIRDQTESNEVGEVCGLNYGVRSVQYCTVLYCTVHCLFVVKLNFLPPPARTSLVKTRSKQQPRHFV